MKALKNFFQKNKTTVVGKDKLGNIYSVHLTDGYERRLVQHPTETFPDMRNIPVEWVSWLNKTRLEPPSEELSEALEKERERRRKNAEEWDREDERMRLQEMALRQSGQFQTNDTQSMEYILKRANKEDDDLKKIEQYNTNLKEEK
eukprot:gene5063-8663_t